MWFIRYTQKILLLISTNFDGNHKSISNYLSTFSIYLRECFLSIRIIGLGQVNKTSVMIYAFKKLFHLDFANRIKQDMHGFGF